MADSSAPAPKKTSRRILFFLILLLAVFLAGFIPMWRKGRAEAEARQKAEHALTVTRMVKDLGAAAIDARRGEYEPARQEASAFFSAARFELDQHDQSALTRQQRASLEPLLASRDLLITLLSRSDPASAERLSELFVSVRKALGV